MQDDARTTILDTIYRHENRMTLAAFQKATSYGLAELRELQARQDVAEVDGLWIALVPSSPITSAPAKLPVARSSRVAKLYPVPRLHSPRK